TVVSPWSNIGTQYHRRDVEAIHGYQARPPHLGVVIRHDQEDRIFPIRRSLGFLEKLPQRPIRIAHGVFNGGGVTVDLDTTGGILPWRMVGHRERQREGGLIRRAAQQLIQLREHVIVRSAPCADKGGVLKRLAIMKLIKPVSKKEPLHIVEMRLSTIDEAGPVAMLLQQLS